MSQYVNFYVRVNDTLAPIADYSRNSYIYQLFGPILPYGKLAPLTLDTLKGRIVQVREDIDTNNKIIANYQQDLAFVERCDAPLKEKREERASIKENIEEVEEILRELRYARNFVNFLGDMVDAAQYGNPGLDNDYNHYIYAGIECEGLMKYIMN